MNLIPNFEPYFKYSVYKYIKPTLLQNHLNILIGIKLVFLNIRTKKQQNKFDTKSVRTKI